MSSNEAGARPDTDLSLAVRRKGIARGAALTLTVLAPRDDGLHRFMLGKQLLCFDHCSRIIVRAKSSKFLRDIRFDSFEFILRHWPSFPFFNEMIEPDFPRASFALIG